MTLFVQSDAAGVAPGGGVDGQQGQVDVAVIANGDPGLGFTTVSPTLQQVTYARTLAGAPPTRLDTLVNTDFGLNPEGRDIIVIPALADFVFGDGFRVTAVGGRALAPAGSGQPGATLNTTTACLAVYDTTNAGGAGYCVARQGGGTDLGFPTSVILYHELSHAQRICTNSLLPLTATCDPSSPEENAAIVDENDLRTQLAAATGSPAELRNPNIHCGTSGPCTTSCCVVATAATGSHISQEVQALREVRDRRLRRHEAGYAFFRSLHDAYYGFSPEVVRLMSSKPGLHDLVRDGYVRPLVTGLRTIEAYTLGGLRGAELGARYRELASDGPAAPEADVRHAFAVADGATADLSGFSPSQRELAELLLARARPDPHVTWGLIGPVRIELEARGRVHRGAEDAELGDCLAHAIDAWAGELPVETFWPSLTTEQARAELRFLSSALLVSSAPRQRFGERLLAATEQTAPIRRALTDEGWWDGDER